MLLLSMTKPLSQGLNKFAILMTSYSVDDCVTKMGLEFLAYAP